MRISIFTFCLFCLLPSLTFAGSLKSAQEKSNFQKGAEPYFKAMEKHCGCTPKLEISWDTLSETDDHFIPLRVTQGLRDAFEKICKDNSAKKNICEKLKLVVVKKGTPVKPTFKDGTLTVQRMRDDSIGEVYTTLESHL